MVTRRVHRYLPWLGLLVGLAVTGFAWFLVQRAEARRITELLTVQTDGTQRSIERRFRTLA